MRFVHFLVNQDAVVGLPLRLVVCLVIGMASLSSILGFMSSFGVIPRPLVVSVSPMLTSVGNGTQNVSFVVLVQDTDGRGVGMATVIISGLGGAGAGTTNDSGRTNVGLSVYLEPGVWEGYLDVRVSAVHHPRYEQGSMVKIVRAAC